MFFVVLLAAIFQSDSIATEAQFLKRGDLPNEFRFPLLELDFAVLRLSIENRSEEAWTVRPEEFQVRDPKNKLLERTTPPEITPKIMDSKVFKRTTRSVHGSVGSGYPSIYGPAYGRGPVPVGPPSSGGRTLSVDKALQIRSILEQHEIRETTLAPGEKVEALVYFKSKKSAAELSGSTLLIDKAISIKVK